MSFGEAIGSLSFVGLCCDIAGAVFLGRAIFFNSLGEIQVQSGTYFNFNPHLRRALCEQRVDAIFGLPLLTIGFVLQALGTLPHLHALNVGGFGIAALTAVVLLYVRFRKRIADWLYRKTDLGKTGNSLEAGDIE